MQVCVTKYNAPSYTVSFHGRGGVNQAHNRRSESAVARANQKDIAAGLKEHIRENGHYEIWIDRTPKEALKEKLDPVIEEYNAKQTRKDRRYSVEKEMARYNSKGNTKENMVRECIVTLGNVANHPDDAECRRFLYRSLKEFQKKNPNFAICGAYYHADEPKSAPHLHIDFIPLHKKKKRGLDLQIGMSGALEDMGYTQESYQSRADRTDGALTQWDNDMRDTLHDLAHDMGISTTRGGSVGRTHEHTREHNVKEMERQRTMEKTIERPTVSRWDTDRNNRSRTWEKTWDFER